VSIAIGDKGVQRGASVKISGKVVSAKKFE
jgi:hypothetical protein